jgi:glutathione S-transferase
VTGGARRASALPELLCFAPMVNVELARLVLGHYPFAYRESDHLFGWSSLLTLFHGGYGEVPLLHGAGLPPLSGPRPIALHLDPMYVPECRLVPREQPLRSIVEADWKRYMASLGSDVAVVCYYHMLPNRPVMTELFARGLPPGEKRVLPKVYPLLRWLFTLLLRLKPGRVQDALLRIRLAFDAIDRRIADGRAFLVGDRLTLSDLSLAAASGPLLLPPDYTAPVPRFEQMPAELQEIVRELRARPTGAFVAAIYKRVAEERADVSA